MSNNLESAMEEDVKQNYLRAMELYEKAILDKGAPDSAFINLSFLCWEIAAEFAFRDKFKIPDDLASLCADRYKEVLTLGLTYYPNNPEMLFWSRYYPCRLFGDAFTYEQAIEIVKKFNNKSLVPFFYLYLFDKQKYKTERDSLLDECNKLKTAKNIYILYIIKN